MGLAGVLGLRFVEPALISICLAIGLPFFLCVFLPVRVVCPVWPSVAVGERIYLISAFASVYWGGFLSRCPSLCPLCGFAWLSVFSHPHLPSICRPSYMPCVRTVAMLCFPAAGSATLTLLCFGFLCHSRRTGCTACSRSQSCRTTGSTGRAR